MSGPQAPALREVAEPTESSVDRDINALRPAGQPDDAYWRKVRSHFDLKPGYTFLNHGTLGPTPRAVSTVYHDHIDALAQDPGSDYLALKDLIDNVRKRLAHFVNADLDEVTLTRSTTEGMNIFAHGLDWKEGDEVLIGTHEHFGGVQPYQTLQQRYGVRIVPVEVPTPTESNEQVIAAYEKAITPRSKLIVVSHVSYVTGLLSPIAELAELAHRHGLLISVDGAQSFGVLPVDLHASGVDHYAAAGQKWLLAGTGTGFSYIRRDVQPSVWPLFGFHDLNQVDESPFAGQRYERAGQKNIPSLIGIGTAVDVHSAIGPDAIFARIRDLAGRLRQGLKRIPGVTLWTPDTPDLTAGLTTFSFGDDPLDLFKTLRERHRIIIRPIVHAEVSAVRVSTHFFNTEEEVDRLVSVLS